MASPTGLTQLGNALLQGSGDYANIQLRERDLERRRAQQLADLQDSRRYGEGRFDIERGLALEDESRRRGLALDDETRKRGQRVEDVTLEVLIKERWLNPADAENPQKIQEAAARRQAESDKTRAREDALPDKLQKEADYLGSQDIELSAIEQRLNDQFNAPQPGPPSMSEVRNLAIRMTGKQVPPNEEIDAQMPAALKAIQGDRFMRWEMAKEDAKVQIPLLRSQRAALRQSLTGLLQQGFVPNRPPPSESLADPMAPPGPREATDAEKAGAAGLQPPPPPPAAAPAPVPAENTGGLKGMLQRIPSAINEATTGLTPFQLIGGTARGMWNGNYDAPADPMLAAGQKIRSMLSRPLPPLEPLPPRPPRQAFSDLYGQ